MQAPHEVRDQEKLQSMIDELEDGNDLPPVVVIGEQALTGSHRIAAWESCGMDIDYIEIEDDDYISAMKHLNLDPVYDQIPSDLNDFCKAVFETTEDDEIKEALKDQF